MSLAAELAMAMARNVAVSSTQPEALRALTKSRNGSVSRLAGFSSGALIRSYEKWTFSGWGFPFHDELMTPDYQVCPIETEPGLIRGFYYDTINVSSFAVEDQFVDGANGFAAGINDLRVYEF